jgi:hypothetical protein
MKPVNMKPFSIEGSVSADQCALLRHNVEDVALKAVAYPSGVFPMPGVEFFQLESSFAMVTYMILDDVAYYYEINNHRWHRMMVPASHIREAKDLIRRVA